MENKTLEKLIEIYNDEYQYLYDNNNIDISKDIDKFDDCMSDSAFLALLAIVADARGDVISSDRECAAFVRALSEFENVRSWKPKSAPLF